MSHEHLPAFFGRATAVLGQHARLHSTLNGLRAWCAEAGDIAEPRSPRELLQQFVHQLESHFAAEEDEGYFGTLTAAFPAASASVLELRREHEAFLAIARELLDRASATERAAAFAPTLSALLLDLARHERAESLLLQQYFAEGQL